MAIKMVSPVQGRANGSPYGKRGSGIHLGHDIPTNGKKAEVFAMYGGKIVEIVRGVKHGSKKTSSPWAPGRTPNLVIIQNPDGEYQLYGHVTADARWKIGDSISMGDYIGKTDLSGNTTGDHLHLEIWSSRYVTRNPAIDFRYFGIPIGSTPKNVNRNPWKTPAPKPNPSTGNTGSAPNSTVKARLKKMGLPQSRAGVVAYQKAHGLFADGDWGPVTEAYYQSVIRRQNYVNEWKRVQPKLFVDGFWGPKSKAAEAKAKTGATKSVPYRPPAFAPKRK